MTDNRKVGRRTDDLVLVAHPNGHDGREAMKEVLRLVDEKLCPSVFTPGRGGNLAPHRVSHELHPVADSQDGNGEAKKARVADGRPVVINAGGSPGKDQTFGRKGGNGFRCRVIGQDLTIDLRFPHRPGDELSVLGSEIEDQDLFRMESCHDDASEEEDKMPGCLQIGEKNKCTGQPLLLRRGIGKGLDYPGYSRR
jgi:hypothetical protein